MQRFLFAALAGAALAGAALTAQANPASYTIDPTHTFPRFEISHLGFSTYTGLFNRSAGKMTLDLAGRSGSIEVTIETGSINTGGEPLNAALRGERFFNVEKFPTMTYRSRAFRFEGEKLVGIDGDLTLLGQTRPVPLAVTNYKCGEHPGNKKPLCGANATAQIKRSDFGMSFLTPVIVGDDVRISLQIEAYRE